MSVYSLIYAGVKTVCGQVVCIVLLNLVEKFTRIERKDSYMHDLKSEIQGYPNDRDNYPYNKTNLNAVNTNANNQNMIISNDNLGSNQNYSSQNNFLNTKSNYLNNAPSNYNNPNNFNNFNLANSNIIPGYKIIKLEDFLEKEKRDCSPMHKIKNEITLDEVHFSLIKFIKNEEEKVNIRKSPEKINVIDNNQNNLMIKSKIFDNANCNNDQRNKSSNNINSEDSFMNELVPKKIDFSLINDSDIKQKLPEEIQICTPLTNKEKVGFDSFGDIKE